jgi:hypothetical protein
LLLAFACAVFAALAASGQLRAESVPDPAVPSEPEPTHEPEFTPAELQALIDRYRHQTWRWQRTMGQRLTRELRHPPAEPRAKISAWKRVAVKTRRRAQHPPHLRQWLCIHRYEASWRDPSAPYYGGLQMDVTFQRRYGDHLLRRKGTADHWTPLEQMWVAERAHRSGRGFYPWPNTARSCGLL